MADENWDPLPAVDPTYLQVVYAALGELEPGFIEHQHLLRYTVANYLPKLYALKLLSPTARPRDAASFIRKRWWKR